MLGLGGKRGGEGGRKACFFGNFPIDFHHHISFRTWAFFLLFDYPYTKRLMKSDELGYCVDARMRDAGCGTQDRFGHWFCSVHLRVFLGGGRGKAWMY